MREEKKEERFFTVEPRSRDGEKKRKQWKTIKENDRLVNPIVPFKVLTRIFVFFLANTKKVMSQKFIRKFPLVLIIILRFKINRPTYIFFEDQPNTIRKVSPLWCHAKKNNARNIKTDNINYFIITEVLSKKTKN